MAVRPAISVIIPTLNEASNIRACLHSVLRQCPPFEIIVADGDSNDDTRALAEDSAQVMVVPRGRARQMNAGAASATGDVLLFLHADARLPAGALSAIRYALQDSSIAGGFFRLRFDADAMTYRLYEAFTRLPWHRMCLGDRAIFVRRTVFEAVGGYADVPLLEDLGLARTVHRRGRLRLLPLYVTTSARRFERNGRVRHQLRNIVIWAACNMGVPARYLKRFYPHGAVA